MNTNNKGFTLIEMAIVIVIMGLIIGTVVPLLVTQIQHGKLKQGREVVETAKDEIIGYAINKGCLPENIGKIGHSEDPWGKELFYRTGKNGSDKPLGCNGSNTDIICNSANTELSMALSGGQTKDDIAFIVASGGPNYNKQFNNATNDVETYAYGKEVDKYGKDFVREEKYDDILEYVTLDSLKSKLGCGPSGDGDVNNITTKNLSKYINNPDGCVGKVTGAGECKDVANGWVCVKESGHGRGSKCEIWVKDSDN